MGHLERWLFFDRPSFPFPNFLTFTVNVKSADNKSSFAFTVSRIIILLVWLLKSSSKSIGTMRIYGKESTHCTKTFRRVIDGNRHFGSDKMRRLIKEFPYKQSERNKSTESGDVKYWYDGTRKQAASEFSWLMMKSIRSLQPKASPQEIRTQLIRTNLQKTGRVPNLTYYKYHGVFHW